MSMLTIVFSLLTHGMLTIMVATLIGVVVVVLHAALRKVDDPSLVGRGLMMSVGSLYLLVNQMG